MDLNELGQDLNSLNAQPVPDEALMAQLPMFLDKYGTMFNNKRGIGLAILNELSRNNVDVSAADDAVQKILDQVRMEATQYMDALQLLMNDLGGFMDKVNTIDESVQAATNKTSAPAPTPTPTPASATAQVDMAAPTSAPAQVDMAAPASAPAPMNMAAPTSAPAPMNMVSDERMKNVQQPNANDAEDIIAKLNYYRNIPEDQLNADMKANKEYYEEQYAALMANRGKYNKDINSDTRNSVRQINEEYTSNTVSDASKKTNIMNAAATRAPKSSIGSKFSAGLIAAARGGR